MPAGKGRGRHYSSFNEESSMRRGIVVINNNDKLCLPRALVVAIANVSKDPAYNKVRLDVGKLQTQRATQLVKDAQVNVPLEGCGIPELQHFQQYLKSYKIVVYEYGKKGRDVIFTGASEGLSLNLLYHKGHFNVITSLTAAFSCGYYCEECRVPYDHKNKHRCGGKCSCCQQSPVCPPGVIITCADCMRMFRGDSCYKNHKKPGSLGKTTICKEVKFCTRCMTTIKSNRKHTCGEIFCKICNRHQPAGHFCFMQPESGIPKTDGLLFVFYDLETRQEKQLEDKSLLHEPNLCVFQQRCSLCINEDNLYFCQKCGFRQTILKEDVVASFFSHILKLRKKFKGVVVVGHNAGGFDHQFLLNYILTKTDLCPELIMRGTRLILMQVDNIKFLDSLNYFSMALSKLPKAFGLTELRKGYFPHMFNTLQNSSYVGKLPAIEFYSPGNMKPGDREKFVSWYEEHKNTIFDMQKDLAEYCISDVDILTQACLKFRKMMLEEGNVCPYTEASTLPSACNKIFRRNFLHPNTIGIIPKNGYRWLDNQSKIAIQWLLWEEQCRGLKIIHAATGPEAIVAGVKVDGFVPETNRVFEFHGCYYHGCKKCIKHNRHQPMSDDSAATAETRYESTAAKINHLRQNGYEVVEKWECDFRLELSLNEEIQKHVENHPVLINLPLNPRDAFYGGRTGAAKMYYKVQGSEKIRYVDVCSLYPYVNKYGKYPVGHPEVLVGEQCKQLNLQEVEGLIKCSVLPPCNLYHPVLPVKMNSRLMFTLCRKCAEEQNNADVCGHGEEERAINGTWVVDEVLMAVEKGYKILDIFEIWKYKVEQYNLETRSGGLFTEYINKFLKIKQQASGYPSDCDTAAKKEEYVTEYLAKEGVNLDPALIAVNPGLRQLGKAVITSFWGKLGQRENQTKTSIVREPEQFFNILCNPSLYVNTVLPVDETCLVVNWQYREESYDILPTVNVCLAAYTTAQARLKLYSYLDKLGDRVLYYDTDSVIYVARAGEYEIPLGKFLGEMTNELQEYSSESFISEFVSGGPKLYAYRVYTPEKQEYYEVCKVKGITINALVSKLVNFEKLRDMILNDEPPVYILSKNIRRTTEHEVVTKDVKKIFRISFKKRRMIEGYNSVPYGYKIQKLDV